MNNEFFRNFDKSNVTKHAFVSPSRYLEDAPADRQIGARKEMAGHEPKKLEGILRWVFKPCRTAGP